MISRLLEWSCNVFVCKSNYLHTGLKVGVWYDRDEAILHGCMTTLVDFIEIDQAHMHAITHVEVYKTLPWWAKSPLFDKVFPWRDEHLGVARLEQEAAYTHDDETDPTSFGKLTAQAVAAKEQLRLYYWWKFRKTRPNLDHMTDNIIRMRIGLHYPNAAIVHPPRATLEELWDKEDDDALHSLINIRKHLWT